MIQKRGLGTNTIYFTSALILQKAVSFIYFFLLSSRLPPEILGKYVFALSYTSLFSIFIDLGLTPILIREASREKEHANIYLQNILAIKIPLSILVLLTELIIIQLSGRKEDTISLVYLSSIIMIFDAFTINFWSVFRAHQNMFFESVATILVQSIIFIFGTIALFTTGNIKLIMSALVLASLFNFLFSFALIKLKLRWSLIPKWNKNIVLRLVGLIPVFALSGIFSKIYNTADSVLLGYLASEQDVGFYAIPAKVITSLTQLLPASFAAALYPVYSKFFLESKEKLQDTFLKSIKYLLVLSLPLTLSLSVVSGDILKTFLPAYISVQKTFSLMSAALPFIFLSFSTGYLLNACDLQKYNTIHRGIMAFITVLGNALLIPFFGYFGSGIIFLLVNILVFLLDIARVRKLFSVNILSLSKIFIKCFFALVAMLVPMILLKEEFHIVVTLAISMFMYFSVLGALRVFSFAGIRNIMKI